MPYFVYRIVGERTLERVQAFDRYREARALARELRSAPAAGETGSVRMVFAADPAEAERLLTEKRQERPLGEE